MKDIIIIILITLYWLLCAIWVWTLVKDKSYKLRMKLWVMLLSGFIIPAALLDYYISKLKLFK